MTRNVCLTLGLVVSTLAALALGAACGDDDDPDPEEYYNGIQDNEDEFNDGAFAEDGAVFGAEDAKTGAQEAADAVGDYISNLDDLNVPDEAQDAHDKLKDGVEAFRDNAQETADSLDEGAPIDDLFEPLFSVDTSAIDEALCELQELAADEDISLDICGGDEEGSGEEAVDPSTIPAVPATEVEIVDFTFGPPHIEVAVGDTVTWTQSDNVGHTATALDGAFDSEILEESDTFEFTFTEAGEFAYRCTPHPDMLGLVTVVD